MSTYHFLLLCFCWFLCGSASAYGLSPDGLTLVSLMRHWNVPHSLQSSWNSYDRSPCSWIGIGCDSDNRVVAINLSGYEISGKLGPEIGQVRMLQILDLSANDLSGEIPPELGNCTLIQSLYLAQNNFTGGIPDSFKYLISLEYLALYSNFLSGEIPEALFRTLPLKIVYLHANSFNGSIPETVGNLSHLLELGLDDNQLSGTIPESIGNCAKLQILSLQGNQLVGSLPNSLTDLTSLIVLALGHNRLEGSIPIGFGGCKNLTYLDLSLSSFSGGIPADLGSCSSLTQLVLHDCKLTGTIPSSLGQLDRLFSLDLSSNQLSGRIPVEIGNCKSLEALSLHTNRLSGEIPHSVWKILQKLDLSDNRLNGSLAVLDDIQSFVQVNLSYNHFTGPIPESLMLSNSPSSFLGNPGLCIRCLLGDNRSCTKNRTFKLCDHQSSKGKSLTKVQVAMVALASVVLVCMLLWFVCSCIFCKRHEQDVEVKMDIGISAPEGSSSLLKQVMEATENLIDRYIIGKGTHGTVYKVSLGQDNLFAVKKIAFAGHNGGTGSMISEMETIGKVRHRNLVRVEEYWLQKDYGLILYKYMPNGSLNDVLHGRNRPPILEWSVRYKIAVGTARALEYLHYHCDPPIIHRDIKPGNILLDEDMEPHISDFGIAKLLDQSRGQTQSLQEHLVIFHQKMHFPQHIPETLMFIVMGLFCLN